MKSCIWILFWGVFFVCCQDKKQEEVETINLTHKTVSLKNDYIGKPGRIIFIDEKIVGIETALDSCFFMINLKNDSLYRFGNRGQAPSEFLFPYTLQYLDKKHFGVFDIYKNNYSLFCIADEIHLEKQYNIMNNNLFGSFDLKKVGKNCLLGFGSYPKEMFLLMDTLGHSKNSYFEFPYRDKDEKSIKNNLRGMAYQCALASNTANNRLAFAPHFSEILHFYEIKNDSLTVLYKYEAKYPQYTIEERDDR